MIEKMNEKAFQIIDILLDDCESQYYSLVEREDVRWDCYDKHNWDNMIDYLKELKKLLINGETQDENETEATREFGKEL